MVDVGHSGSNAVCHLGSITVCHLGSIINEACFDTECFCLPFAQVVGNCQTPKKTKVLIK